MKNPILTPPTQSPLRTTRSAVTQTLPDVLICFSHLRWDFVYQRPQHILSRLAKSTRIYYIEEPVFGEGPARYDVVEKERTLTVLVPQLPHGTSPEVANLLQTGMLNDLVDSLNHRSFGLWYYTPMALSFSRHLKPAVTIFDVMDELSAFRFAPKELLAMEQELLDKADVVFTGGASLYEAKKGRHANIHLFPSSIDRAHFGKARMLATTQAENSSVCLGFFGVIDERFDIELLGAMAAAKPEWQYEIVGPVVKIDAATLPRHSNIHYAGGKKYDELPGYLSGWDIALIPFALNESTKFISPTKTPEYLAAGKPVISSPIRDVVNPYGEQGMVHIAATAEEWIAAAETILADKTHYSAWLANVDAFLEGNSWDATVAVMQEKIAEVFLAVRAPANITAGTRGGAGADDIQAAAFKQEVTRQIEIVL